MMRKQADTAARFVHREFDERSNRAVVGDRGVVTTDRRDEHTLAIEGAVNGLDRCSVGLVGVCFARTVEQRQAVYRQALGHTINVEFRLAPLPSIEHVYDRARDEPGSCAFLASCSTGNGSRPAAVSLPSTQRASSRRTTSGAA